MRSNPWFRASFDLMALSLEAGSVIALRTVAMTAGGPEADRESQRMVREKLHALVDLQTMFFTGRLGTNAPSALNKTVTHYRRKVRANKRRLTKARCLSAGTISPAAKSCAGIWRSRTW